MRAEAIVSEIAKTRSRSEMVIKRKVSEFSFNILVSVYL